MKVLVGCEESQKVTKAFRELGHEAWSCDLMPTRGIQDWHKNGDVVNWVTRGQWDLIILHPPCTALCWAGNGTYGRGKRQHWQRVRSVEWTCKLWKLAKQSCRIGAALENPTGIIWRYITDPVQWIHPHQFGHGETKRTGMALHNLPPLMSTKLHAGRRQRIFQMGPSPTRSRDRSETYDGIAEAMAHQWGGYRYS